MVIFFIYRNAFCFGLENKG